MFKTSYEKKRSKFSKGQKEVLTLHKDVLYNEFFKLIGCYFRET